MPPGKGYRIKGKKVKPKKVKVPKRFKSRKK
jgi:hypothetical protein